jgi:CRP/FNR family cyclic AMP-dependent transcriptional regulator
MNRYVERLSRISMFKGVPEVSLAELVRLAPIVRFKEGDAVFRQGDTADVALLVLSGGMTASVAVEGGKKTLGEIAPGELIGEQALFISMGKRSATVMATELSQCLIISPQVIDQAYRNPAVVSLELKLLGSLVIRIRQTNESLQELLQAQKDGRPGIDKPEARKGLFSSISGIFGGRK